MGRTYKQIIRADILNLLIILLVGQVGSCHGQRAAWLDPCPNGLFLTCCIISSLRQGLASHAVVIKNSDILFAIIAQLRYKIHC